MRLLISAEESAGIQAIKAARDSGHEIVAVLTTPRDGERKKLGATVEGVSAHFGYPVWPASRVKDPAFAEVVERESVDILLNVHSLHIVHEKVVTAPRVGAFNLHPGPLPRYAGMNAPSWAILNGEATHGVTLHWMEAGIDTGAIAYQEQFDLAPRETAFEISRRCSRLGLGLIKNLFEAKPDRIPRIKQDLSRRSCHGFELPFEGEIPWHSAELLERFVRACYFHPLPSPWGVPTIPYRNGNLGILELALTDQDSNAPAGTVELRGKQAYLATDDYWLELRRAIIDSDVITWAEKSVTPTPF